MTEEHTFFSTKRDDLPVFDIHSFTGRQEYFQAKAGKQISEIKEYLKEKTFIVFLLAKKGSGKGVYTKLIEDIFGQNTIGHISVGDVIRKNHKLIQDTESKEELLVYLKNNYRGHIPLGEAITIFENKNQSNLLPTEFVICLVKKEIYEQGGKAYFIDGFPRGLDQIPYSLFFKELIDLRNDPDIFVTIDTPETLIEARIKTRVVCPQCQMSRNIAFLPSSLIGYDEQNREFYLICDNPECHNCRMICKEGDQDGINSIRERLDMEGQLMKRVSELHGVEKINLVSTLDAETSHIYADDYELTKEFTYVKKEDETIEKSETTYTFSDDEGKQVHSLVATPVVVQFIYQLHKILINKDNN